MADPVGLYMINDSDSEELKRQKINSNFNILLSGLTSGLGSGSTGSPVIFGGNGFVGSSHGYYNAVRDRLEVDRLYAEHLDAHYANIDFANIAAADISNAFIHDLVTDTILVEELSASFVDVDRIEADEADISAIKADNVEIRSSLTAHDAKFEEMSAGIAKIDTAVIGKADIADLDAAEARIGNLEADHVSVSSLDAANAKIDTLQANVVEIDGRLDAHDASFDNITADIASIDTAIIGKADIDFANVDVANINSAFVNDLMVQSKFIAQSGTVYTLTALQINADDIKTGTLTVDRLVVQNQTDHEYYMLEPDGNGGTIQTKLEGSTIKQNSINADRIIANSITTDQITANNLIGTGGWINLASGTFHYSNAETGDFIDWDGTHLTLDVDSMKIQSVDVSSSIGGLESSVSEISQDASRIDMRVVTLEKEQETTTASMGILRDEIYSSIQDSNGSSLFVQKDGKFVWNVDEYDMSKNSVFNDTAIELDGKIDAASDMIANVNNDFDSRISNVEQTASGTKAKTQSMRFDGSGLILSDVDLSDGKDLSGLNYLRISSNDGLEFYSGGSIPIAYMRDDMLYIENEQILKNLRFGNFKFFEREGSDYNGDGSHNMGLKWIEG